MAARFMHAAILALSTLLLSGLAHPLYPSGSRRVLRISGDIVAIDEQTGRAFVAEAGRVTVLDAARGAVLRSLSVGQYVGALVVDTAANHVYVTTGRPSSLRVLDARTGAIQHTWPLAGPANAVAVSARTQHIFVLSAPYGTGHPCLVTMLDRRHGTILHATHVGIDAQRVAVDDATVRVFVLNAGSNTMSVLDASNGRLLATVPVLALPYSIAVSARTGRVFVTGGGGVEMRDARNGRLLQRLLTDYQRKDLTIDERHDRVLVTTDMDLSVLDSRTGHTVFDTDLGLGMAATSPPIVDGRLGRIYLLLGSIPARIGEESGSGRLEVLDAATGAIRKRLVLHDTVSGSSSVALTLDRHTHRLFALTDHTLVIYNTDRL